MDESELDLGPLVDHHCHGLVLDDLQRADFESLMNEAAGPSALGTTLFDSMLGLAVRRWCAPVLGLEPLASAADYLQRRRDLGAREASRRLVAAAGISTFLVDTGIRDDRLCTPGELARLGSGTAHEVVRLETVAEGVLDDGAGPAAFADEVEERLRSSGAVGAKSIAAYRVGLDLPATRPSAGELTAALADVRPGADGRHRLAHAVVHAWLAWTAIELAMPLQLHVGFGDNDLDLLACDPLRLTPFLRATQDRGVPVLLLHNYPFHRNAAYLAQAYDQVFLDVGLAVHNTGALSAALVRETLEVAPFGKLLFSTDAYGLAENYLLGAHLFRRALGQVVGRLLDDGEITRDEAARLADLVARSNARRVYRADLG
jgi:predicted TIM-barrel fold metal-dependent hydrolase